MSRDSHKSLSLRPATAADLPFLRALFAKTRAQEMTQTGWPPEMQTAFLEGQFEAQRRHYEQHFRGASFDVIMAAGQPVGRIYVARLPEEIRVVEITLAAACRNRGWGTGLLKRLCAEAEDLGLPLRLNVDGNNRARRLYLRLGFKEIGREGAYLRMERRPSRKRDAG